MDLSAAMSALAPALTQQGYQPPPGPYPGPIFNLITFGGKGDMRTCTVTTNGTTTIASAGTNPCVFTTADTASNKIAWVMNPANNHAICGSQSVQNNIVSQTGSAAVLANACTASVTGTAVAYIGTDNYPPMQLLAAAIIAANGGEGYAPSGYYAAGGVVFSRDPDV